ncbi:MAG: HAMP domain-containing protein [Treponemataceae bacterium]|nr:HAMP domain-containing protein [Treponemataceae bacterium]
MTISKFFKSLQFRLIILVIAIIVFSNASIISVSMKLSNKTVTNTVEALINAVTDSAAGKIKGETEKQFRMLEAVANMDFLKDPSASHLAKCQQLTRIAGISDDYENIGFYDLEGNSYTAAGQKIKLDRVYIKNAAKGQKTVMDPAINPVTHILFQIYAVPVFGTNGKPIGCISANVMGDVLSKKIEQVTFGTSDSHIQVISIKSGHTIASNEFEQVLSFQNVYEDADENVKPVLEKVMAKEIGSSTFINPANGMKMLAGYRPVPGTDWAVFGACAYADFYSGLTRMTNIMSALGGVVMVIAFILVGMTMSLSLKPLKHVKIAVEEVAAGDADLTKRIKSRGNDEVAEVVQAFNNVLEKFQSIIKEVKEAKVHLGTTGVDLQASTENTAASITEILANIESVHGQINSQSASVHETAGAVNEIASNIDSLEKMIEKQSSGVSDASAAVEEMIGNIQSVNASMSKMTESFASLTENAKTGIQVQMGVNDKITQIKVLSDTLQEANVAIAAIAEQTNLLAMNAAIEAAHAGDAGKGFSVVADEIRKLSETSTEQSQTIGDQLTNIKDAINDVVIASEKSTETFNSVSEKIKETDQVVHQIEAAMQEQNEGSRQISNALHVMNDSTLEVRTAGQEMAEGNKSILAEVQNLQDATNVMLDSMTEMTIGAKKINETGETLRTISKYMDDSIREIGNQIDLFKV